MIRTPLLMFAALAALTDVARAEEPHGYPSVTVQNREHFGHHELDVGIGVLPMDAFRKGFTVSGAYTLRFDEIFGWEIGRVVHSFPFESGLADELRAFDLEPQAFEIPETIITSSLVFAPIYWKGSLMNEGLVRGEILFVVGGGVGVFTRSTRGGFDVGMALRLYLSSWASVRLDTRYLGFIQDRADGIDVHSEIWIGLSLGIAP